MTAPGIMATWPRIRFQVCFGFGATGSASTDATATWTDLSSRLTGQWSADQAGRQYELDQVQSGTLSVTLANTDGALDPLNASSIYYPNVLPLRPCRLQAIWPPSQNLVEGVPARGLSIRYIASAGTFALATGLSAAPSGQSAAGSWTLPSSVASGATLYYGLTAPTATDLNGVGVVAGRAYTMSVYLSRTASGGETTMQAAPVLRWYSQAGAVISTSTGSAVSIARQGSWTRATVSATAPAGAVWCRFALTSATTTTTSNMIYFTAWQIEQAAAVTTWADPGTTYSLWTGYVERWPQTWDYSGTYPLMSITGIDALAALAAQTLSPSLRGSLLALGPRRMYPLDEPAGTAQFRDIAGGMGPGVVGAAPAGSGTLTAGVAVEGGGSFGSSGPVVRTTNPVPGNTFQSAGSFVDLPQPGPPAGTGWSRVICFRTTTATPLGGIQLLWGAIGGTNASETGIYILDDQMATGFAQGPSGGTTLVGPPNIVTDGRWHCAVMTLSADGLTLQLSVDGILFTHVASGSRTLSTCTSDTVGGYSNATNGFSVWWFQGDLAYATEYARVLTAGEIDTITRGFASGWSGDSSAARMGRILSLAGYTGPSTTTGTRFTAGALAGSGDAMSALQLVADSESGQVYADGAGVVSLAGAAARWLQLAPTLTFGENLAGGEIPYLGDIQVDLDPTHIYNAITVTNAGAAGSDTSAAISVADVPSQARYLPRSLSRATNLNSDSVAADAAAGLLVDSRDPHPRIGTLTVDASAIPSTLTSLLGLRFGQRVRVVRRPPSPAATISLDQYVEKVSWSGDAQGRLQARLQCSPAPASPWAIVASLHVLLTASASIGATSITVGALTGSATNTARAVLPVGTVLTVGYGTAAAENVTVAAVGSTTAGYTSVALTVTALTAAHSAGDLVCQPLPGSVVLPAGTAYPTGLDAPATLTATSPRVAY
jgi:hypothetical protein